MPILSVAIEAWHPKRRELATSWQCSASSPRCRYCKASAGLHQIGQGEQGEQLRGVFGQPTIAGLPMVKQVFDDWKVCSTLARTLALSTSSFSHSRASFVLGRALRLDRFIATCQRTGLS